MCVNCQFFDFVDFEESQLSFVFHVRHQYKYQINIDGTVAAYRLPYLLAGDSVVLKQDSGYYEHFYNELRPWEHYIPIRADLGDLLEKIQWAREHDEEVMMMIIMSMEITWCNSIHFLIYCPLSKSKVLAVFQVKKIALAGQQFARNHLMGDSIFCYYYKLFQVTLKNT